MVAHAFNPSTREVEQADFWVRGQPGLQSEYQDSQGYTEKPCLKKQTKQENTIKQVEVLTEKEEKTYKQVIEMNKTILDLKREVDTIKKTQSEAMLEIETLERNLEP